MFGTWPEFTLQNFSLQQSHTLACGAGEVAGRAQAAGPLGVDDGGVHRLILLAGIA